MSSFRLRLTLNYTAMLIKTESKLLDEMSDNCARMRSGPGIVSPYKEVPYAYE